MCAAAYDLCFVSECISELQRVLVLLIKDRGLYHCAVGVSLV